MTCIGSWTFVPLTGREGFVGATLVDSRDAPRVLEHSWNRRDTASGPYAKGAQGLLHRFVLGLRAGDPHVDHRNHDGLDNRRLNLRAIGRNGNMQNCRPRRDGVSPYRGVSPRRGRFAARARIDGNDHWLGTYDTELEAAEAAADFRREFMPYSEEDQS